MHCDEIANKSCLCISIFPSFPASFLKLLRQERRRSSIAHVFQCTMLMRPPTPLKMSGVFSCMLSFILAMIFRRYSLLRRSSYRAHRPFLPTTLVHICETRKSLRGARCNPRSTEGRYGGRMDMMYGPAGPEGSGVHIRGMVYEVRWKHAIS